MQVTFSGFCRNSKWPPQINFNFLGGVKTQKIRLVNFFLNFNITFLATWGCASDFLKMLLKFKMAARGQLNFFVGAKTLKLKVRNYANFTITFPTIWRCASDFFKLLLQYKMAAMDKLHILKSVIIHIVQSHYPPSGNVHVILLKFKMATTNQLFVGGAIGPPRLLSWSREIFGTKSEVIHS